MATPYSDGEISYNTKTGLSYSPYQGNPATNANGTPVVAPPATVINTRTGVTAATGTRLGDLLTSQNAAYDAGAAKKANQPTAPAGYEYKWIGGVATGDWQLYALPTPAPAGGGGGVSNDSNNLAINALQQKYDALLQQNTAAADAQKKLNQANVSTAIEDFRASLKLAGLDSLVDTIDGYIKQDLTAAQIKINLVGTQAYKDRFPGMATLAANNRAVSEAAYISMERGYTQVLSAYGLDEKTFGSREKLATYIANEVSPTEFENRVQLAVDHVKKNPDVLAALHNYYGVDTAGAVGYLLDPKQGMDVINKQVRASEIGAAAETYKFDIDKAAAESFIAATGSTDLNTLKQEFGKARLLATTQSRLSQIEDGKYSDTEAVSTILNNDQQKLLESQQRAMREQARFAGSGGVGNYSLRESSGI
jgi:hypothetical protein